MSRNSHLSRKRELCAREWQITDPKVANLPPRIADQSPELHLQTFLDSYTPNTSTPSQQRIFLPSA